MPAEIKKKMRPQSISFGMSDNYEQKTIPKPDENITKTPITDTVFSNKYVNLLLFYHKFITLVPGTKYITEIN